MKTDTVFVLCIFAVFALCVCGVLVLCGSTYRRMVDTHAEGHHPRVLLSYIRTMVRNADTAGSVRIEEFHGQPALAIYEPHGPRLFVTYIYAYDGWARELFFEVGETMLPYAGVPFLPTDYLHFNMEEKDLLRVVTSGGYVLLHTRSASTLPENEAAAW